MVPTRIEGARLEARLLPRVLAGMQVRPAVRRRLQMAAQTIEQQSLFHPVAVCRIFPVALEEPSWLRFDRDYCVEGDISRLTGANEAAIVFVTLGPRWSGAVATCLYNDEPTRGFLLDEIGTTLLERLAGRLQAMVRLEARRRGLEAGSPVQPGQAGWPLSMQSTLAELAEAHDAGIEVTDAGMLVPVKSLSMIIGIGRGVRRWTQQEACRECAAFERCEHRRSAERCQ